MSIVGNGNTATTGYSNTNVMTDETADGTGAKVQILMSDNPAFTSTTIGGKVTINNTGIDLGSTKITNLTAGLADTDAVNVSQLTKAAAAAKTEVKQGDNVTVSTDTTAADGHTIYTVNAADMRVKSGTVTYGTDGTGTATLTNGDGSTATVSGLKNTYTASGALNGTTETFTRNDGTTYAVDLSSLAAAAGDVSLKFGANSGTTATNKSGSTVTIAGTGTKEDSNYSGDNIKTKVTHDAAGDTVIDVMLDNNMVVGGKDGKDGSIGVKGADGKSGVGIDGKDGISITGKDGTNGVTIKGIDGNDGTEGQIGLTGPKGADGKTTEATLSTIDGNPNVTQEATEHMTRIGYVDEDGVSHQVATLDDGMKYQGDSGTLAKTRLNQTVNVIGGVTDSTKLTDGNIGTVSSQTEAGGDATVTVKLNKDLTNLTSITMGAKAGDTVVSIGTDGLHNGGNKITNVAAGAADTDAVNVSQLTKAAAAAKTEVKQGDNVTVSTDTTAADGHTIYTVNAADMRVKSGTVTYGTDGTGTATLTNGDGSTATVSGLKNTYTASGALNGTTETFTRNDGTTYAVDLSGLTTAVGDTGLKFGANSGNVVTNKLGSTVTIAGAGTKADSNYSGNNLKTVVSQDTTTGNTTINVLMDNDITANSVTVNDGKNGKDGVSITGPTGTAGVDGVDGKVGVTGKDGKDAVSISGKDGVGHIGLTGAAGKDGTNATADVLVKQGDNGVDGTDGHNGKDGMDRIEYKDHNDVTHQVATLEDGMKYMGDSGVLAMTKLNQTVNVIGGVTDSTKLTDGNIGTVSSQTTTGGDATVTVKLNKDLTNLTSITMGAKAGDTVVSIGTDGLHNGGNKITNVAAGAADTDAVNVSQLEESAAAATTKLTNGTNTTVTSVKNTDGSTTYAVNVNPHSTFGTGDNAVDVNGENGTITAGAGDKKITINGKDGSITAGKVTVNTENKGTINGLTNKTWDPNNITSGQAATEDQLKQAISDNTTIINKSIGAAHTTVSVNNGGTGDLVLNTKTNTDGGTNYDISLSNDITLGGKDGTNGSIGLAGKDGKDGVTVYATNGTDGTTGHIGLTGAAGKDGTNATADVIVKQGATGVDGTDGKNGKDGMDRIEYTDHNQVTHEVATLDDGMKYSGDTGSAAVKLDKNVAIKGETAAGAGLTNGNIGVVASQDGDNAKLVVKLADNLTGIKNITTENFKAGDTVTINNTGIDAGNTKITNVKNGDVYENSKDAVNGGQLYQTNQAVTDLGNAVGNLDNRVNKVGAGAAALAALHPLDFDPDDKWDFAAGYGNYKGTNAAAIGAYYRPNEDTMFSIGGSVGNGENMVNAGVSFKIGQGNHVSTSRVAMAKELKDLRKEVENLRSMLVGVSQGQQLDMNKMKLFPDIPANHWAYDAIKTLAGNGIVEGYPSGSFDGDRMMTRYEFAMIVYRAMQKGANVNGKLINEFEPELERIRVDTIAKDKNGKPTIERVRVIHGRG